MKIFPQKIKPKTLKKSFFLIKFTQKKKIYKNFWSKKIEGQKKIWANFFVLKLGISGDIFNIYKTEERLKNGVF